MDPLPLLIYIVVFPGFLFLLAYSLFLEYLDRKIAARMQNRVGPPLLQPLADLIKTLGKEVINPKGVDRKAFDAAPMLALAAVMTAFLYIPIIGESPLAFQGDLVRSSLSFDTADDRPLSPGMDEQECIRSGRWYPCSHTDVHIRGAILPRTSSACPDGRFLVDLGYRQLAAA